MFLLVIINIKTPILATFIMTCHKTLALHCLQGGALTKRVFVYFALIFVG
jgi:hypothetical protein